MVRKKPEAPAGAWFNFESFKITPATIITLVGWIILGTTFYVTTNSTLTQHEKALTAVKDSLEKSNSAREKLGADFLMYTQRTAEGVAQLNKEMALSTSKYETLAKTLDKLGDQIDRRFSIPLTNGRR